MLFLSCQFPVLQILYTKDCHEMASQSRYVADCYIRVYLLLKYIDLLVHCLDL